MDQVVASSQRGRCRAVRAVSSHRAAVVGAATVVARRRWLRSRWASSSLTMMVGSLRDRPVGRRGLRAPPAGQRGDRLRRARAAAADARDRARRRHGPRRRRASSSSSSSATRSPRRTSSASRPGRACSRSASIVLFDVGSAGISLAALVGALVSCAVVYVLAWRDGISGYRFILIGIGVSEFMFSIVGYLLARAEIYDAREAMTWLVGSVGQAGTRRAARRSCVALVILLSRRAPARSAAARPRARRRRRDGPGRARRAEPPGADRASRSCWSPSPRRPPDRSRSWPSSPARSPCDCSGRPSGGVLAAGFVGAAIVLASDLVAEHLLPVALPTGVVTGAIGAPYLIWLLATANRDGTRRMTDRTAHELRAERPDPGLRRDRRHPRPRRS